MLRNAVQTKLVAQPKESTDPYRAVEPAIRVSSALWCGPRMRISSLDEVCYVPWLRRSPLWTSQRRDPLAYTPKTTPVSSPNQAICAYHQNSAAELSSFTRLLKCYRVLQHCIVHLTRPRPIALFPFSSIPILVLVHGWTKMFNGGHRKAVAVMAAGDFVAWIRSSV